MNNSARLVWGKMLYDDIKHPLGIFFLILYKMGMEDKDLRHIMGITQEASAFKGGSVGTRPTTAE